MMLAMHALLLDHLECARLLLFALVEVNVLCHFVPMLNNYIVVQYPRWTNVSFCTHIEQTSIDI